MKQVTEVPEWFARMPLDGKLTLKEVATIFGFAPTSLPPMVFKGEFIEADGQTTRTTKHGTQKILLWSKKLILQEINRRKEIANATSRD